VALGQTGCYLSSAWTCSEDDNIVRKISLDTLAVEETITIDPGVQVVDGITGIAVHPTTGDLWLLAYLAGSPSPAPFLLRYDMANQFTDVIGSTFVDFIALDFQSNGDLNTISADTANPVNSFCVLDQSTGAPTDICSFGGGDDGEAIAWHTDGRLFHASGALSVVFEGQTVGAMSVCDTTPVTVTGTPLVGTEVTGISYWPSTGEFLWSQAGPASALYRVSETGGVISLGSVTFSISDVAVVEIATPCPPGDQFVRGDTNDDGTVNIADVVFTLNSLFVPGSPQASCPDAADFNDDGTSNIADAIFLLNNLFVPGSPALPPPNVLTGCGMDPTDTDPLDCPASSCP